MTQSQLGDYISLTTNDGQVLTFPNDTMTFVDWGSFGAPPVSWITRQGYKQHGETEVGYYLGRRTITLHLHYNHAVTRAQYWANRNLIHNFLRHNRTGPMTLTVTMFNLPSEQGVYTNSGVTLLNNVGNPDGYNGQTSNPLDIYLRTVVGGTPFAVNTVVQIDGELELVTQFLGQSSIAGHQFNWYYVKRGYNGTTVAAHNPGSKVYFYKITGISQRSIIVRADPGMKLDKDPTREAGWYLDEDMNFLALNPIWFDPQTFTQSVAASASQNLVFPITFPIVFSVAGFVFSTVIPYAGTWYAYPTITLTGPYQSVLVQNISTGVSFSLVVPLAAGQQRIISTTPGAITVLDQNGQDHFNELGTSSDLVDFNLRPAPEVPSGANSIQISMYNPNLAQGSAAQISFQNTYIGI